MAVGVRQIASDLRMSPSTVSKALRGKAGEVSLATVNRVLGHCQERGYISDMDRKRTLLRLTRTNQKRIYFLTCQRGVLMYDAILSSFCETLGRDELFPSAYVATDFNKLDNFPFEDAAVVVAVGRIGGYVIQKIGNRNMPVVLVDHNVYGKGFNAVNSSNSEAMCNMVETLYKMGHRSIGFFCNHEDACFETYTFHQRQNGYIAGLANVGLPLDKNLLIVGHAASYDFGEFDLDRHISDLRVLSAKVLELDPLPTAVIAANDMHAFVLKSVLEEAGYSVPGDISIVGYDGQQKLGASNQSPFVPISTLVVDWAEMGKRAAELALNIVLEMESASKPTNIQIPVTYEDAGTVSVPRQAEKAE